MNEKQENKYRWSTPQDWLQWAYSTDRIKASELLNICLGLDSDTIQANFESAMDEDGYFDEYCDMCESSPCRCDEEDDPDEDEDDWTYNDFLEDENSADE